MWLFSGQISLGQLQMSSSYFQHSQVLHVTTHFTGFIVVFHKIMVRAENCVFRCDSPVLSVNQEVTISNFHSGLPPLLKGYVGKVKSYVVSKAVESA